jgi:hypothetical protein
MLKEKIRKKNQKTKCKKPKDKKIIILWIPLQSIILSFIFFNELVTPFNFFLILIVMIIFYF